MSRRDERDPGPPSGTWDASYEGAERALLDFALRATLAQRLAWLEQAIELAYRAGALSSREKGATE